MTAQSNITPESIVGDLRFPEVFLRLPMLVRK